MTVLLSSQNTNLWSQRTYDKCDGWYGLKQQIMLVDSFVSRPHAFNYNAVGVISGGAPSKMSLCAVELRRHSESTVSLCPWLTSFHHDEEGHLTEVKSV